MRGKKALINTIMSLVEEFIAVVCGFVLPRIILSVFGSSYNGLTTSITQFLSCVILLRAGVIGATRAALYKPLAENNVEKISSIVKATDRFMKKVALIIAVVITAFSIIYPMFVLSEFGYIFTLGLFIIIGLSTFAEAFFGTTYMIVLQADQKLWVSCLIKSITYILNTIVTIILVYNNFGIRFVKLGSAIVFVLYPIVIQLYVRRKYKILKNVEANSSVISQRWDAFWHSIANFTMNNTDVIVLTVFLNMLEVSVYSVYNLIINGIKRTITAFSNGLEAAFGNMIAKKEEELLNKNFCLTETLIFSIATVIFSTAIIMILQFVRIYTYGVSDVDYLRPMFAYILLVAQCFNTLRIPYQVVVQAAGHYKQTKKGAIIEPILNIVFSVVFVILFGIVGVAIGTLIATVFRTMQYSIYMGKNIIKRSITIFFTKCLIFFVTMAVIIFIFKQINLNYTAISYWIWIENCIIVGLVSAMIVAVVDFIFFPKDTKYLFSKLKNVLKRRKRIEG